MAYEDDYLRMLGIDPASVSQPPVQPVYPENSINPIIDADPIIYSDYKPQAYQHLSLMQQLAGMPFNDIPIKMPDGATAGSLASVPVEIAEQIAKSNVLGDKAHTERSREAASPTEKRDLSKPYHYNGMTLDDKIIQNAPPVTGAENKPFYAPTWFNTHPRTLAGLLGLAKVTTGKGTLDGITDTMKGLDSVAATSAMGSDYVNNRMDQLVRSGLDLETARAQALTEFLQGTGSTRAVNTLGLDTYTKAADAAEDRNLGIAVSAGGGYDALPGFRGYTPNGIQSYRDNGDGTISIVTPRQTYTVNADNAPEAIATGLNGAKEGASKVVTNMINAAKQSASNAKEQYKSQSDLLNERIKVQNELIRLATEQRKAAEKAAKASAKGGNNSSTSIDPSNFS